MYIQKNSEGVIVKASIDACENAEFVDGDLSIKVVSDELEASDASTIRVLDDLITLLVEKNVIQFTELPMHAQRKLLHRETIRQSKKMVGLISSDDSFGI